MKKTGRVKVSPGDHTDFYMIKSWSAFSEYAKHRPDAILDVSCKDSWTEKVLAKLQEMNLASDLLIKKALDASMPDLPPVQFRVKLQYKSESDLLEQISNRSKDIIVVLDHITDPRNLGAIARSMSFFGARDIIVPNRRQVLLTSAAVSTAQGGFAFTDVTLVSNLSRILDTLKTKGYWVIGTDMGGESLDGLKNKYEKVALIMGSEDKGMSKQIHSKCDIVASIPSRIRTVESLNVSVACGIFLYELADHQNMRS